MRGTDPKNWKSEQMKRIVSEQKKNNLRMHTKQNMQDCFQALGSYYQQKHNETLNEQEQIGMWMAMTGMYGRYRLNDY
jgi:predicted transcriptional regulator